MDIEAIQWQKCNKSQCYQKMDNTNKRKRRNGMKKGKKLLTAEMAILMQVP